MRIQSRLISQFDEESRARAKDQEMETIDKGIADALHEAASLTGAMIQTEKTMLNPQPMYEAPPPSEDLGAYKLARACLGIHGSLDNFMWLR